ncbi:unnamed protein product [Linum trigynum]|uniref:Uncharacterized protein n=1 Tax=Linum trigynum TaxID=586398 RepID=A0AAV2FU77_9ROSI
MKELDEDEGEVPGEELDEDEFGPGEVDPLEDKLVVDISPGEGGPLSSFEPREAVGSGCKGRDGESNSGRDVRNSRDAAELASACEA